jgi:GDPmannose 4,6-dehydratase
MSDSAVIIGAGGQDGSFLLEKILKLGGMVYAVTGSSGLQNRREIIDQSFKKNKLIVLDNIFKNYEYIEKLIKENKIDTIFHLASVEKPSGELDRFTNNQVQKNINSDVNQNIVTFLQKYNSRIKYIFASSSKMYEGYQSDVYIDESTELKPLDDYGFAKASAVEYLRKTRDEFGLNLQTAILFNHDSNRRKKGYLIWDVVEQIRNVLGNKQNFIELNQPKKSIDISDARDIVDGIYLMSQSENQFDYVIGQGNVKTVGEICVQVLDRIGLNRDIPIISKEIHVETPVLKSNINRIKNELNWFPKRDYISTVHEMI